MNSSKKSIHPSKRPGLIPSGGNPLLGFTDLSAHVCPVCGERSYRAAYDCRNCRGLYAEAKPDPEPVNLCACGCGREAARRFATTHCREAFYRNEPLKPRGSVVTFDVDAVSRALEAKRCSRSAVCRAIGADKTWLTYALRRGRGSELYLDRLYSLLGMEVAS